MIKRTRTKRTIVVERLLILENPESHPFGRCIRCKHYSRMVTPTVAAQLCGLSLRQLFRLVEESSVHFAETSDGMVVFCVASLADIARERSRSTSHLIGS